jgi:hypothetical protein
MHNFSKIFHSLQAALASALRELERHLTMKCFPAQAGFNLGQISHEDHAAPHYRKFAQDIHWLNVN